MANIVPEIKQYNRSLFFEKYINCNQKKIWKIISEKSNLELFHPFCSKNRVIQWNLNKSIDEIEYLNGNLFRRTFYNWIDDVGYDLYINAKGKPKSHVSWRIININDKSKVRISIYPYIFNINNNYLNFLPYYLFVKPLMVKYLYSVLEGLKWYAENDKPVSKNQFGRHIWFS